MHENFHVLLHTVTAFMFQDENDINEVTFMQLRDPAAVCQYLGIHDNQCTSDLLSTHPSTSLCGHRFLEPYELVKEEHGQKGFPVLTHCAFTTGRVGKKNKTGIYSSREYNVSLQTGPTKFPQDCLRLRPC